MGNSLVNNKPVLIPASLVYISNSVFKGNFLTLTSSGLSASENYLDAILQGLLEIVEHDSWMILQSRSISTNNRL